MGWKLVFDGLGSVNGKLLSYLADLGCWGVSGGCLNLLKKGHLWQKIFMSNFESTSEKLQKMISVDRKADLKQQEIKELVAIFYNFL